MKNTKKVLLVCLIAVLAISVVFVGCAKKEEGLVLNVMGYGDNAGAEGQTFLRIIDAFQAENPDITVVSEMLFDEAYHQKVVARLASGDVPDVAYMGSDARWGAPWVEGNQQADITSYIDASVYDTAKFGGVDTAAGAYTYVPLGTGNYCTVMFTNEKLIKELGFDTPKTYEDLVAMVPAAKAAGIEVLSTHGADSWVWGSCYMSTAVAQTTGKADWPQQLVAGKVKWSDPDALAALETLEMMVADGVMSPEVVLIDDGTGKSNFSQGKALCYLDGQWAAGGFSAEIQETMGMEPIPALPGAKGQTSTIAAAKQTGYGVSQAAIDAGKADAAMKFINFFNSVVEVEQRIRDGGITGSVLANHVLPTDLPRVATLKNDLGSKVGPLTQVIDSQLTGDPNTILCTGMQEIVSGKKSAAEVAAAVDAAM